MTKLKGEIEKILQTVYDPDFPLVDIYTLGLIYDILINEVEEKIKVLMTFTTPACPMADYLIASCKQAVEMVAKDYEVEIEITFEPMRSPKMIRDEDLQRMFE